MSKKYTRNYNSIYATFLKSYKKTVAEFATQVTVEDSEPKPKYRRGVRASLALGGIGAGYALGKNPEAQETLKTIGNDVKDRAVSQSLHGVEQARQLAQELDIHPSHWFGGGN